jgi:hypothetical protein
MPMNLLSDDHGTARALARHLLYGIPVCDACLDFQDRREQTEAALFLNVFRRRTARLPRAEAS